MSFSATPERIAACLKACEGISTESLEANGVASYEQAVSMAQTIAARDRLIEKLRESLCGATEFARSLHSKLKEVGDAPAWPTI